MRLNRVFYELITLGVSLSLIGCERFVEISSPKDQIINSQLFNNDETVSAAVRGIYARMISSNGFASGGTNSVSLLAGRSSDDFVNQNQTIFRIQFSENSLQPDNSILKSGLWQEIYQYIYTSNSILEGINASENISNSTRNQLNGEAKFIRAFCHFYLCNLFGSIPLVTSTDYRVNNVISRSSIELVYEQIIKDLTEAKSELNDNYPTSERVRPNKYVVTALLARVYLYRKEWEKAEKSATELISNTSMFELTNLDKVFLKNSKEAILQFMPPPTFAQNTYEGKTFILTAAPGVSTEVTLSSDLLNSFDPNDLRLSQWIGTFSSWRFPYKYKIKTGNNPLNEYSMVFRLAEQYLIRAEARINQDNKIPLGIADLNIIRKRARPSVTTAQPNPLPDYLLSMNKVDALLAVENERRWELFSEWGHRWLDLKRTNRADIVLKPVKGINWEITDVLYPIPSSERLNNNNLTQNDGYN
jgi:hypothetical protein